MSVDHVLTVPPLCRSFSHLRIQEMSPPLEPSCLRPFPLPKCHRRGVLVLLPSLHLLPPADRTLERVLEHIDIAASQPVCILQ